MVVWVLERGCLDGRKKEIAIDMSDMNRFVGRVLIFDRKTGKVLDSFIVFH